MDYGKVLSRAWEITWRWKVLWILGFLVSLGSGGGGGGSPSYTFTGEDIEKWTYDYMAPEAIAGILAVVAGVVCLAFVVAIALWVISVIARGGLIAGVQQVEDEGSTSFLQAWRVGRGKFWTLFGIGILAAIPMLIMVLVLVVVLVVGIFGAVGFSDTAEALAGGSILAAVACGCGMFCGMIILAIVLEQIRVYAERAAILEDMGWVDAFKRGWEVLKENVGPTIIFWFIFLGIGLFFAALVIGGMFVLAIPMLVAFSNVDPGPWLAVPFCCGGLIVFIIAILVNAIVQTFTSATWTLAYREMTGLVPQTVAEIASDA
jgi:hypothetical protein